MLKLKSLSYVYYLAIKHIVNMDIISISVLRTQKDYVKSKYFAYQEHSPMAVGS